MKTFIRLAASVKFIAIFVFLQCPTIGSCANKIDSLRTDDEVISFLKSVNENFNSPKYDKIELRSAETIRKDQPCEGVAEKWQVKNWERADFNGDGLMDLVVILYWYNYGVYTVIDKGNNEYALNALSFNVHDSCKLAKPLLFGGQQLLLYYGEKNDLEKAAIDSRSISRIDTLIYKYGEFIEFNPSPGSTNIDSIQFHTGACFGSCPVFKIRFDRNGQAEYEAGAYNPKTGTFSANLHPNDLKEIFDLVTYLEVESLHKNYSVSWTDDQTVFLRIKYADGKIVTITDYGLRGTFGLRALYNKFFALRTNQDWK